MGRASDKTVISASARVISNLEDEIARLRGALKPFVAAWDFACGGDRTHHLSLAQLSHLAVGEIGACHFERAKRTMED